MTIRHDDATETTATADLESILGMFCACGAPERMLRWHYRSRHESLIAVSNHEFYDNRLVLFPSPDAQREETGLHFRHNAGTCYERGNRKRFNAGEAGIVADAVMEHVQRRPNLTLGVAAFNLSQARRIEDEVRRCDLPQRTVGPRPGPPPATGPARSWLDDPPHLEHRLVHAFAA